MPDSQSDRAILPDCSQRGVFSVEGPMTVERHRGNYRTTPAIIKWRITVGRLAGIGAGSLLRVPPGPQAGWRSAGQHREVATMICFISHRPWRRLALAMILLTQLKFWSWWRNCALWPGLIRRPKSVML